VRSGSDHIEAGTKASLVKTEHATLFFCVPGLLERQSVVVFSHEFALATVPCFRLTGR
jgi:hypothetical protein